MTGMTKSPQFLLSPETAKVQSAEGAEWEDPERIAAGRKTREHSESAEKISLMEKA